MLVYKSKRVRRNRLILDDLGQNLRKKISSKKSGEGVARHALDESEGVACVPAVCHIWVSDVWADSRNAPWSPSPSIFSRLFRLSSLKIYPYSPADYNYPNYI